MDDALLLHRVVRLVGALGETGAIAEVADAVASVTGGDRSAELIGIGYITIRYL